MTHSTRFRLGFPLLAVLLLTGRAFADAPPVIDCPWYSPTGGDPFASRGFYVASYPGTTLKTVTLYLSASTPGSYSLTLTARQNGGYGGTLIGTATASPTFSGTAPVPVTFGFGTVSVSGSAALAFKGSVTGPGQVAMEYTTSPACIVTETDGTDSPLSTFRHPGLAVRMTGDLPAAFPHSVTLPAVASIHGANNTFFHTDLWLQNLDQGSLDVTATYYCYSGMNCGSGPKTFSIAAGAGKSYSDIPVFSYVTVIDNQTGDSVIQ